MNKRAPLRFRTLLFLFGLTWSGWGSGVILHQVVVNGFRATIFDALGADMGNGNWILVPLEVLFSLLIFSMLFLLLFEGAKALVTGQVRPLIASIESNPEVFLGYMGDSWEKLLSSIGRERFDPIVRNLARSEMREAQDLAVFIAKRIAEWEAAAETRSEQLRQEAAERESILARLTEA